LVRWLEETEGDFMKRRNVRVRDLVGTLWVVLFAVASGTIAQESEDEPPISEATQSCLFCHEQLNPGLVGDWRRSRHARMTVAQALEEEDPLTRRVSAETVPEALQNVVVGCAECHTMNPDAHPDTVEHKDHRIHAVVSPPDCAVCHPVEASEFEQNLMAHAHNNLARNALYLDLAKEVNGVQVWDGASLVTQSPHLAANEDSCFSCHGTEVKVLRKETRNTALGEMEFAVLSGWPNNGVGRINPDGSHGSCAACHPRHEFSIEVARRPETCGQCHNGPDVPAYKVYEASKHGNIFESREKEWDFEAVPWIPGEHFNAPTCATCHISLLADENGRLIAKRTHRMNDRLFTRLFGLPYAHPHPKAPTTFEIHNAAGLPLPTELTGEPATEFLIDATEQAKRRGVMQGICRACHSQSWTQGHFDRLDHTIETTNAMTLAATKILMTAWEKGVAKGPADKDSLFNESIERMWVEQWFFYANSTRFAAAMAGADYGVFANGRWYLSKNLREMETMLKVQSKTKDD